LGLLREWLIELSIGTGIERIVVNWSEPEFIEFENFQNLNGAFRII